MYDYAQVQLLGRATEDALITGEDGPSKATFTLALNLPIRRGGQLETRTVYRRVMVLGAFVNYVASCQQDGGIKSRLINVLGVMDDERFYEDDEEQYREVIRVAPGAGSIKIMDRRVQRDV